MLFKPMELLRTTVVQVVQVEQVEQVEQVSDFSQRATSRLTLEASNTHAVQPHA